MAEPFESTPYAPIEIFLAILPTIFLSFISLNLYPAYTKANQWKEMFTLDFFLVIVPLLLGVTILADHLPLVNITLLTISGYLVLTNRKADDEIKAEGKDLVLRPCITNLRSTTSILSVIAILAVDFSTFPTRFQKTHPYGFSLMDVGVGTYIVSNAMVARETRGLRTQAKKTAIGIAVLATLGLLRYLSVQVLSYHVNVLEYGTHWNFFFTLAAARLISAVVLSGAENSMWTCGFKGFVLIAVHQIFLTGYLEEFVFSDFPRDDFFSANREGIVSSLGYAGLYVMEVAMSYQDNKKSLLKFSTISVILAIITAVLYAIFDISRCVANSTYCFWILLMTYVLRTIYYTCGICISRFYCKSKRMPQTTFIFEAINYNPLVFFMVANLLTGLVNVVFVTGTIGAVYGLIIVGLYLLVNCLVVSYLYVNKCRLKF